MPRRCLVCSDARHREVETDLLVSRPNISALARKYGIARGSIEGHRRSHLPPRLARAAERSHDLTADALLRRLTRYLDDAEASLAEARALGDHKNVAALIRSALECTRMLGSAVAGLWQPARAPTVNVNVSVEAQLSQLSVTELRTIARLADGQIRSGGNGCQLDSR